MSPMHTLTHKGEQKDDWGHKPDWANSWFTPFVKTVTTDLIETPQTLLHSLCWTKGKHLITADWKHLHNYKSLCTCVKLICTTLRSAISPHPSIKDATLCCYLQAWIKEAIGTEGEQQAMAEGSDEEEFVCVVEELQQQEDEIELKFQMKFRQQLLTMSSIMACPLERLDKGSSPFWVGALWQVLSGFFGMRTGNSQCYCHIYHCVFQFYCIALLAEQTVYSNADVLSIPFKWLSYSNVQELHWEEGHCHRARSEGCQYHHSCCHLQWWGPLPHTNYWPIQYRTPHHISWCIEINIDSTRRERAVEAWHDSVCHNLGQCGFPPLSPCEWMVCSTASYYDAIPPCILAFSEPNRGVLLCLEVEGVWSPAIWADATLGGNEWWLPGNRCRGLPGLDMPCKEVFPSVHCKGKHSMRSWWEPVA